MFHQRKQLLFIFAHLALYPLSESSISEDVVNFMETFMTPPVTIIMGNSTEVTPILKVNYPKVLVNVHLKNPKMLRQNNSNIIVVDDLEELEVAVKTLSSIKIWHSRQKHLVVFLKPVTKDTVRQAFGLMFKRWRMVNTVVYYKNDTFYTWYPYSQRSRCGARVNLVRVRGENPFTFKIPRVVQGCNVNVTWSKMDIFLWDPLNKTYPGAMPLFFNTIAKKMNITVTYLENNTNFMRR